MGGGGQGAQTGLGQGEGADGSGLGASAGAEEAVVSGEPGDSSVSEFASPPQEFKKKAIHKRLTAALK
jgi:hypothetical protein